MNKRILGCTSQTYKPCTCQSLRPKRGPGVSNRVINGLMDRGAYMPGPRSWSDTPPCVEHLAADSFQGREGGYQSEGGLTSGWFTSYQRNHQRTHPFVRKVISLLFNMLSRFAIAFLSRSKCLLIAQLQSLQ